MEINKKYRITDANLTEGKIRKYLTLTLDDEIKTFLPKRYLKIFGDEFVQLFFHNYIILMRNAHICKHLIIHLPIFGQIFVSIFQG